MDGPSRLQDDAHHADYQPGANEADLVNAAMGGINLGINLKEPQPTSDPRTPVDPGVSN